MPGPVRDRAALVDDDDGNSIPWKIYASRALSAWGDRMWAFGGGLFVLKLDESGTLRLVGVYGLVTCVSVILFGATIGNWIDAKPRLLAAQVFLAIQNLAVAVCCAVLAVYFWDGLLEDWAEWVNPAVSAVVIFVAMVANLAAVGSKIVVEKDWIVVIARGDNNRLAQINSVFRTIDLTCLVLSPMVAGLLFDFISTGFTAVFIACWNVVSVCFEYWLLAQIYKDFPGLAHKPQDQDQDQDGEPDPSKKKKKKSLSERLQQTAQSWQLYLRHPVRNAGLGLACLYMTVLGFDNITYGFCLEQCVRESVLGSMVGVSAVVGVTASVSFPFIRRRINVTRTGVVGFLALVSTLALCVVSIWLPGSPFKYYGGNKNDKNDDEDLWTSTTVVSGNWTLSTSPAPADAEGECEVSSMVSVTTLMAGIVAARYGLWMADLSITQLLQENVDERVRGTIGGVQGGLNSFMDTIKFALVIALPQQDTFGWLIMASYASICLGFVSYLAFARRNWRGEKDAEGSSEVDTEKSEERENGGFEEEEKGKESKSEEQ